MINDLQASHEVLQLFEKALSQIDSVLDDLPSVFAVITTDGTILKGNALLARLFGIQQERLLSKSLFSIFSDQSSAAFRKAISEYSSKGGEPLEIELEISSVKGRTPRCFIWSLSRFGKWVPGAPQLFSVIGKDVTEFRFALYKIVELERDVEIAAMVQQLLLPKKNDISLPSMDLTVYYESATKSSGDWWWYDHRDDGSVVVLLGDVSGHGLGATMVTAVIAGSYHTLNRELVASNTVPTGSVVDLFRVLDGNLKEFCNNSYWLSLSAVEVFPAERKIRWWNAGGPPLFTVSKSGVVKTHLLPGACLGNEVFNVLTTEIQYNPGDRILMYTDGMYECKNSSGDMLRRKQLYDIFSAAHGMKPSDSRDYIVDKVTKFRNGHALEDDASFAMLDLK